jgi:hypothetical protein
MKGFLGGLQTTPIASVAHGYGLEVLGPHVRRHEVDKRCLENIFLRYLALVFVSVCFAANSGGNSLGGGVGGRKSRLGGAWFRRVGQIKIGLSRFIETAVAMSRLCSRW